MIFLLLLYCYLVKSAPTIFTRKLNPLQIGTNCSSISLTAINSPKDAFLIASYFNKSSLRYSNNEWTHDYSYYSIENYLKNSATLTLTSNSNFQTLSVAICSLTQPIPSTSSVKIQCNSPVTQCLNKGTIYKNTCSCKSNYIGSDCSILATSLSPSTNQNFSVASFSGHFFKSSLKLDKIEHYSIEIQSNSNNLQTFFRYKTKKVLNSLPSFLCTENYKEFEGYNIKFHSKLFKDESFSIVFSVFCFSSEPCEFNIKVEDEDKKSDKKKLILIASIIGGALFFIILGLIFGIKFCKKKYVNTADCSWIKDQLDKAFPCYEIEDEMRVVECSVCFEDYQENFFVRKIRCGHIFHAECIDLWFENNPYCPICRECVRNVFVKN